MGGTKFIFYMVELARFMVDSFSFRKSRRRWTKYWVNGTTRCLQYLASFFETDFRDFNLLCHRLIVYNWRRSTVTDGGCKDDTSNDPFSRWKSVQQLATDEIDDHKIQSDYKCAIGLENPRGKNSALGIASARWNRARHQWQRDNQDPDRLPHRAHLNLTWACV